MNTNKTQQLFRKNVKSNINGKPALEQKFPLTIQVTLNPKSLQTRATGAQHHKAERKGSSLLTLSIGVEAKTTPSHLEEQTQQSQVACILLFYLHISKALKAICAMCQAFPRELHPRF